MTPPFACFPVCMTLSTIGLIAVVMLVFNLGNRIPGDDQPPDPSAAPPADGQPTGPPPLWVLPVMMLVLLIVMLILGWYWPE